MGIMGSRDGAVVRTLVSHHFGPGSIPAVGAILVEFAVGSCLFSGYSGFPASTKTTISRKNWMKRHPVDLPLRFSLFLCEERSFWRQVVQKRNGQAEENLMEHLTEKRKRRKKSQTAAINWLLHSSKACATKDSFQAWAVQSWLMPFNLK